MEQDKLHVVDARVSVVNIDVSTSVIPLTTCDKCVGLTLYNYLSILEEDLELMNGEARVENEDHMEFSFSGASDISVMDSVSDPPYQLHQNR